MYPAVVVLIAFFASASAKCDNACSGHGTCDTRAKCQCYDNWGLGLSMDTGDCSQRICPFEFAWVDTPDNLGQFHKYSECASKGICNRDTGECECFPGFEGKGCQRAACPNDCSGHGQCTYIQDLPFQTTPQDYNDNSFLPQSPHTFTYYGWDATKTRGCVCDPEYGDVDCSKRMCPYGTDVMDIRQNMAASAKYQVQQLDFVAFSHVATALDQSTFAITFKSKLNETFTTAPIEVDTDNFHDFTITVRDALQSLPNRVIDQVDVAGGLLSDRFYLNVTFVGNNVQGPQNLLTVKAISCGDGCTPQITGLNLAYNVQNSTQITLSDFNSFECGRRGKCDYTTGICSCFAGYTGASCNVITALV